jgi:membrane protein
MKISDSPGLRLLFEVSRRSIRKYLKYDNMTSYAAALAYRALFAIVPFLALLVALLWFLGIGDYFSNWLTDQTSSALGGQLAEVVGQWIKQSQFETQGERLSIGIVAIGLAIWSVSSGVRTLTKALNVVHEVEESRPSWKRYGLSFFYALGLAIMVILATALLLIGPKVVEWIVGVVGLEGVSEVFISLWRWLRLPVALVLLMLTVSIIYWVFPNVNYSYRLITPGAALAVIGWTLASLGFSFYLANFANYSVIYGSIGAAFVLLLYFYISAEVLLLGAEVNAAIHHYASDRHMQVEEHTTDHEAPDADEMSRKDN